MGGTKQVDKSLNAVTPKGILGVAFTEVVQNVETSILFSTKKCLELKPVLSHQREILIPHLGCTTMKYLLVRGIDYF